MDVEIKTKKLTSEEWVKRNRERYEKRENSLEGIHYNLGIIGDATTDDDKDKILICKVLQRLPKDIRERVLDETLFVLMSAYGTIEILSFPVSPETKEVGVSLIIMNFALMRNEGRTERDLMDAVAHEIAHYILGHDHHSVLGSDNERKADDLTEKWGFKRAYDSYEEFELSA